jgi:hypothetical protein
MQLADFIALHLPALEKDEVRHNLDPFRTPGQG